MAKGHCALREGGVPIASSGFVWIKTAYNRENCFRCFGGLRQQHIVRERFELPENCIIPPVSNTELPWGNLGVPTAELRGSSNESRVIAYFVTA